MGWLTIDFSLNEWKSKWIELRIKLRLYKFKIFKYIGNSTVYNLLNKFYSINPETIFQKKVNKKCGVWFKNTYL